MLRDEEYAEVQVEGIEQNIVNVREEQDAMEAYQEVLGYMLRNVQADVELVKKRTLDLQQEEKAISKQSGQCELLNNSTHFMNISITSKFNYVKNKTASKNKELQSIIENANNDLAEERDKVQRIKLEIAKSIQLKEELMVEKERLEREFDKVEDENRNMQRISEHKLNEYRLEMMKMMEIDV